LPQNSSVGGEFTDIIVPCERANINDRELTNPLAVNGVQKAMTIPMSASLPLHAKINCNIKNKICSNEYIVLGQLLHPDRWDQYNMSISTNNALPTLALSPQNRKIRSIDQWLSAFNIYSAIYLDKFPGEAHSVLKYIETVRRMADKGGNYLAYDENVRYMRQIHSPPHPWDHFYAELYVDASSSLGQSRYSGIQNNNSRLHPVRPPLLIQPSAWFTILI